jgi:hypothetical protein
LTFLGKDLIDKFVYLLLVLLAALKGNHSRVVQALTALAVVRMDLHFRVIFILRLEWHIAKHDTDVFLGDQAVVVEVEPFV